MRRHVRDLTHALPVGGPSSRLLRAAVVGASAAAGLVLGLALGAGVPAGAQQAPQNAAEDVRIGYVDLQRAIFTSNPGKEARKSLDERTEKLKKEFEKKQEEVRNLQAEFMKQSAVLSPDARSEKE